MSEVETVERNFAERAAEDSLTHILPHPNSQVALCGKRRNKPSRVLDLKTEDVCDICQFEWDKMKGKF